MLFSVEQAFVGRDETRAPLITPPWEVNTFLDFPGIYTSLLSSALKMFFHRYAKTTSPTFYSICCLHFKVI